MWKPFYDRCSYFYLLYFSAQFQRFLHKLQHAKKFFFLFFSFLSIHQKNSFFDKAPCTYCTVHTETKWNFEPKDSIRTRTFQVLNWSSFLAPNHYFFFFIENYPCSLLWQSWFLALKNSTYDNFLKLSKKSIFTIEKKLSHAKSFEVWLFLLSWQLSLLSAFQ